MIEKNFSQLESFINFDKKHSAMKQKCKIW